MREGSVCQLGLTCAKGVANGGESSIEQMFPTPPRGVLRLEVVFLETDAPHGVERAGFSQTVGASEQ